MSKLWILGAGQLGAMLQHAAQPLNIQVQPVPFEQTPAPQLAADDRVSAEIEQWPDTPATRALAEHPHFVNRTVFPRLADRLTQKQLLDELAIPTSPWRVVDEQCQAKALYQQLGKAVLLKRRTGGYDGRGQHWLQQARQDEIPTDWLGQAIAEQKIPFTEEVSLIGVRNRQGELYFYPLTLNLHVDGILMASVAPLARLAGLQPQAEAMLGNLLTSLDYVGVMAMECFRVGDQLLVNELAPRVHNSGHWTQAGASISQFEYHVRAVCEQPLTAATIKGQTVMLNLIGVAQDPRWLSIPGSELFWYGKQVRPGRKVGHLNLCAPAGQSLQPALTRLKPLFPQPYPQVFDWLAQQLTRSS